MFRSRAGVLLRLAAFPTVEGILPRSVAPAALHRPQTQRLASTSGPSAVLEPRGIMGEQRFLVPEGTTLERRHVGFSRVRRSGCIAIKCGMTQEWDANGARVPLTVLWLDENQVVQVKTEDKDGYLAVQIGSGTTKPKRTTRASRNHMVRHAHPSVWEQIRPPPARESDDGERSEPRLGGRWPGSGARDKARHHFGSDHAGRPLVRVPKKLAEFRVTAEGLLPPGAALRADHFVPGQFVDVAGTSKGKGFQGGMKRHGFAGQEASHGNTKAHRRVGSIGACQDPGKVWKGKKLPGQMGNKRRTDKKLLVYKVDPERNLVWVKGSIPGNAGNYVFVRDSLIAHQDVSLPLPTMWPRETDGAEEEDAVTQVESSTKHDPFTRFWR